MEHCAEGIIPSGERTPCAAQDQLPMRDTGALYDAQTQWESQHLKHHVVKEQCHVNKYTLVRHEDKQHEDRCASTALTRIL